VDLELDEDERALVEAARQVLERFCPTSVVRAVVEQAPGADKAVEELWSQAVALDWPMVGLDESLGGLGLGAIGVTLLAECLGEHAAPGPLVPTIAYFTPMVLELGSPTQRAELATVLASGQAGTLALAERTGTFGLDGIEAVATRHPSGYVLRGTKRFVVEADRAARVAIVVRLEDGTPAAFVVPRERLQLAETPLLDRSKRCFELTLDGLLVGDDECLAAEDPARAIERATEVATLATAAECVGACERAFRMVLDHVRNRRQFGVPIGSFQAIKHKLANCYGAIESARALTYFAAAAIAEDDPRRHAAVAMAKAAAGECEHLVAVEAIQCFGGMGYTWEHDLHLFVKRARTAAALFGTAREQRARLAAMLGLASDAATRPWPFLGEASEPAPGAPAPQPAPG
jgi:alkylation response protein AidB-like acyl-CoA dehydrogenase